MPFSGGTYTGLANSFNDAVSGTVIDPLDWNELFTDIELGITLAAGGSLSVLTYIPINEHAAIRAYTSTTDLRVYINLAISAANSSKCALLFPSGLYPISAAIGVDALNGIMLRGAGGRDLSYGTSTLRGTIIKFTGTGSGDIVTLTNHRAVTVEDIQVCYVSNSFTGTFFNCSTTASTGNGSVFRRVQCYQITNNGLTAGRCWYLRNNVDVTFENCYASHASNGWVGLFDSDVAGDETNIIKLIGCTSTGLTGQAIVNPKIGWTLIAHNFEQQLGASAGAPSGIAATGSHAVTKLTLVDCTGADATAAGTWIDLPVVVNNFNMFGGGLFGDASHAINGMIFGASSNNLLIRGARLRDLTIGLTFGASTVAVDEGCNDYAGTTTAISGRSNCDPGSRFGPNNPDSASSSHAIHNTGLWVYDTDSSHVLKVIPNSNLTADRQLRLTTGDADRTITLSGDPTLADWFDQSVKTAAAATFASVTVTSSTVPANGMYLPASNTLGWAISSAAELQLTSTAFAPVANGGSSLGVQTSNGWQNLFGNVGFVFNLNSDWVATHSAAVLTVGTGDLRITNAGTNAASVVTLNGTQTLANKTLNAAVAQGTWTASGTWTLPALTLGGTVSGGGNQLNNVIVGTSTPLAGTFTAAVANSFVPNLSTVPSNGMYLPAANTLGWAVNSAAEMQLTSTALSPAADGGNSLGTTALGWQNLFANTGFVLNIENSDWVATHTTGILTVGTGDLRVTTAGSNSASVATVGGTQELTSKTLNASVGKGTWTASGTWTLPAITLGGAITYGGVALSNAVTGTGNMVLATSPALTTPAIGAATGTSLALTNGVLTSTWSQAADSNISVTNVNASTSASASISAASASGTISASAANNPNAGGQASFSWTGSGAMGFHATHASGSIIFSTNVFTTALTISSAQVCTFANTIRINQAASSIGTGTKTISNAADGTTNFGKYFSINLNGTVVYIPCSTVAPT